MVAAFCVAPSCRSAPLARSFPFGKLSCGPPMGFLSGPEAWCLVSCAWCARYARCVRAASCPLSDLIVLFSFRFFSDALSRLNAQMAEVKFQNVVQSQVSFFAPAGPCLVASLPVVPAVHVPLLGS